MVGVESCLCIKFSSHVMRQKSEAAEIALENLTERCLTRNQHTINRSSLVSFF